MQDIWRSPDDGVSWELVTSIADFGGRIGSRAVGLAGGSVLLMGGKTNNEVWVGTNDCEDWREILEDDDTTTARWGERYHHNAEVLRDGSILLFGGIDATYFAMNDQWKSWGPLKDN